MAKAELGVKRRCLTCATPFYDLNRLPIVCPKCAAAFQVVEVLRSAARRPYSTSFARPAPVSPVIEPVADHVLLASADDEEDTTADEEEDSIDEVLEEVDDADAVETAVE
ncbi:TIGR02300 family protein [Methylocystis rosea]|uniref:TIGR02300 family protein n=1 Tax=Methylocystis rosea TaxID=173366 RepID=A0ABX6EK25_9HYPH|nr:TIGR02300 family protein [Methylocystis rosea]QGM94810.1 TIGR02300 family protein [Methylocystis rosea]